MSTLISSHAWLTIRHWARGNKRARVYEKRQGDESLLSDAYAQHAEDMPLCPVTIIVWEPLVPAVRYVAEALAWVEIIALGIAPYCLLMAT